MHPPEDIIRPTEVRLTAINWEWSVSLRLSRSCELPYGFEAIGHCQPPLSLLGKEGNSGWKARRYFGVECSQKTSLCRKNADDPRCKDMRRKKSFVGNQSRSGVRVVDSWQRFTYVYYYIGFERDPAARHGLFWYVHLPLVAGVDVVGPAVILGEGLTSPGLHLRPGLRGIRPEKMVGWQTERHEAE